VLQAVAWLLYVGTVLTLFLRPQRPQPARQTEPAAAQAA
jgi:high-affinity iron transporter